VLKVIRGLAEEGRTMILVTHEMRFARDVSSVVVYLHEGRVEDAARQKPSSRTPAVNVLPRSFKQLTNQQKTGD
jgi:ABC-type histidine transport system ATPase subunit